MGRENHRWHWCSEDTREILNSDSIKDTIDDKLDETTRYIRARCWPGPKHDTHRLTTARPYGSKDINRENDFVSVTKCLASGKLSMNNIALNLLLDIG